MNNLAPGDMCIVVKGLIVDPLYRAQVGGKTVILLEEISQMPSYRYLNPFWSPYWRCSGLPPSMVVSHKILQKIPPAPLMDEPETQSKPLTKLLTVEEYEELTHRLIHGRNLNV